MSYQLRSSIHKTDYEIVPSLVLLIGSKYGLAEYQVVKLVALGGL